METVPRHLAALLREQDPADGVVGLVGPRRSGKTTLAERILPQAMGREVRTISFDDPDERLRFKDSLIPSLRGALAQITVLDEVHKAPYVLDGAKVLFDRGELKRTLMILTGSSQILMLKEIKETLAGRISLFELFPFSAAEVNGTRLQDTVLHRAWREGVFDLQDAQRRASAPMEEIRKRRSTTDLLLRWGGYPPVVLQKDPQKRELWLRNYRRTYVERDVPDAGGVGDEETFLRVMELLALRSSNLLSYSDVARDAGCSPHTVKRYLKVMEITFQAGRLSPYHPNVTKRLVKAPKAFCTDTGVLDVITKGNVSPGALFETFLYSELLKWNSHAALDVDILFYRTAAGMEVDFVLSRDNRLLPLEAKTTENPDRKHCRSLRRFLEEYGNQAPFGILVHKGNVVKELAPRIFGVPAWLLLG